MSRTPGAFEGVIELYRNAFAAHGHSTAALLYPKDRREYRFGALTSHFPSGGFSVLDYGCGLAHMKEYLDVRHASYAYCGADMVPEFIADDRLRHPAASFHLVTNPREVPGNFDHVVMSGIFNTRFAANDGAHFEIVADVLRAAFAKANRSMAVDFMIDAVDFRHPDAYHQNVAELLAFAQQDLSPRLRFDLSYMPFEFAMIAFKDASIKRPQLVYPLEPK